MMKRYVKELANDILCKNFPEEKRQKIERIIYLCDIGIITSCEAAKEILEVHYGDYFSIAKNR